MAWGMQSQCLSPASAATTRGGARGAQAAERAGALLTSLRKYSHEPSLGSLRLCRGKYNPIPSYPILSYPILSCSSALSHATFRARLQDGGVQLVACTRDNVSPSFVLEFLKRISVIIKVLSTRRGPPGGTSRRSHYVMRPGRLARWAFPGRQPPRHLARKPKLPSPAGAASTLVPLRPGAQAGLQPRGTPLVLVCMHAPQTSSPPPPHQPAARASPAGLLRQLE
jgi:hypothetical protein